MKIILGTINRYYNVLYPISDIQFNLYIDNNSISNTEYINLLRNIVNTSNFEIDDIFI